MKVCVALTALPQMFFRQFSHLLTTYFRSFALASALVCLAGCASKNASDEIEPPMERRGDDIGSAGYKAGIGDAIDIFVLEDSSFNGLYVVRPSGDMILPKAGRIAVLGMSLAQVEASVKQVLEANQLTQATVIADPVRRGAGDGKSVMAGLTIYLAGPGVMHSGRALVPFVGDSQVTAFQAITDAGGFAAFANKKRSYLLRKDRAGRTQRLPIDFTKVEKGQSPDPLLQDGDTIVVPQKIFGF